MTDIEHNVGAGDRPSFGHADADLKIAILLPESPDARTVRRATELALCLLAADDSAGHSVQVTIGLAEPNETAWRAAERRIRSRVPSVIVRHVSWTRVPVDNVRRMFADLPPTLDLIGIDEVAIPRDWGWNFRDCDLWISMADPGIGAVLPLRPVAHYCTGLPERYVPAAVAKSIHDDYWKRQTEAFRLWRQGLVFTSDPDTADDLVSYAGVRRERVALVADPLDTSAPLRRSSQERGHQVLWLLQGNAVDDLENALAGLAAYYREGGTLQVTACAERHEDFASHPSYYKLSPEHQQLFSELPKVTWRSVEELNRLLPTARCSWSSVTATGTEDHVHEAVRAGLHLFAPRFRLNERSVERLGATATLYERSDPLAIADAFQAFENAGDELAEREKPLREASAARNLKFGFLIERMLEGRHVD